MIEETLKHKMILCTGPSFARYDLLKQITERDMEIIPFKKIFLATNDPRNLSITFSGKTPHTERIKKKGKQLDCLNALIRSISNAVNDPECLEDDILLFKHESVFIRDMYLVSQAVRKILEGFSCVVKYWVGFPSTKTENRLNDYFHSDSLFLRVGAAKSLFSHCPPFDHFPSDSAFCEEALTRHFLSRLNRVFAIPYHHSSWQDNELGLYHIPRYEDPPEWLWDKKNYHEIYQ